MKHVNRLPEELPDLDKYFNATYNQVATIYNEKDQLKSLIIMIE